MAIWIASNIDIGRSLNSRDGFPRWKFKNRAPTSYSPGPILWPPTISFELHAEMAEEIDVEKCTFRNFGSSLTLTLDRVEVTLVCICGRGPPTHEIRWKSEKVFVDVRTDTPEFQSTRSSPRRWPKNWMRWWRRCLGHFKNFCDDDDDDECIDAMHFITGWVLLFENADCK